MVKDFENVKGFEPLLYATLPWLITANCGADEATHFWVKGNSDVAG
jgi:hypothetical protein